MSGAFQYRVNRLWSKSQANLTTAVFFWELMKFVESHTGLSFVGYGTGKVQSGTTPPSAWLNWNPVTQAVPWSDNSWFVFQADYADALLDGTGGNVWQVKAQMTLTTGFDDCNVANVDYGEEGGTYRCCLRCSAKAGWNATTLDFPTTADQNRVAISAQDEYMNLDFIGDYDTIFWRGCVYDTTEKYPQARGAYIGMLQRKGTEIAEPFFSMIGQINDSGGGSGALAIFSRRSGTGYAYYLFLYETTCHWPAYSLWVDGTRLVGIDTHKLDTWSTYAINRIRSYKPTGEDVFLGIMVAQWTAPNKYAIIGELRFLYSCGTDKGEGQLSGSDPKWLQICVDSTSYCGVVMRWPAAEVPIW